MTEDYFWRALWNENIKISQSLSMEIVNNTHWWGGGRKNLKDPEVQMLYLTALFTWIIYV